MTPQKRRRAAAYVRVSTDRQAEEGFGLDVQRSAIREWATRNGVRIARWHADEGVSGSASVIDRPGLAAALGAAEAGGVELLLVYRLDRVARDLVLQETVLARLRDRGVDVVSVTEPDINGTDPTRVLIRQILGALAQYERALILARMQAGRAAKAAKGGYAHGAPPFGWIARGGQLVPDPREQESLRRAHELRRAGDSYRAIAARLDAEGHSPRRASSWSPMAVRSVLRRPADAS